MPRLEILNNDVHVEWVVLTRATSIIGRDPSCHVALKDDQASRRHAEIVYRNDGYWIKDLGSTNGTIVNDKPADYLQLKDQDRVRIGTHEIVFFEKGAEDEKAPEPEEDGTQRSPVPMVQPPAPNLTLSTTPDRNGEKGRPYYTVKVAELLESILEEKDFCHALLDLALKSCGAERACMILRQPGAVPRATYSRDHQGSSDEVPAALGVMDRVLDKKESVAFAGPLGEANRVSEDSRVVQQRSVMVVPLRHGSEVLGALQADGEAGMVFDQEILAQFTLIGELFADALVHNGLIRKHAHDQRMQGVNAVLKGMSRCIAEYMKAMKSGSRQVDIGIKSESMESVKGGWSKVRDARRRLDDLLRDVGEVVGDKPPIFMAAELNTLVGNALDVMKNRAAEGGVTLDFATDDSMPEMDIDPMGVYRAVKNLITNAIEATAESKEGRVKIRTEHVAASGLARIVVEDNGAGIGQERRDSIFMLFNTSKREGCLGLGLPVAQKTAKDHGGRILLESKLAEGSTFVFELPIRKPKG